MLALPGWPTVIAWHNALVVTRKALRILFALLYGARLRPAQLSGPPPRDRWVPWTNLFDMGVIVCSYAEYLGCLNIIGPLIMNIYHADTGYWEAVSKEPIPYLLIAVKLQNTALYHDSQRHMIAQAHMHGNWEDVVALGKHSEKQIRDFYEPQMRLLSVKLEEIKTNLIQLQLDTIRAYGLEDGWHTAYTRNHNITPSKIDRVAEAAQCIYGKFLAYRLSGEKVTRRMNGLRSEKAG